VEWLLFLLTEKLPVELPIFAANASVTSQLNAFVKTDFAS
jgi:hypothetical protein